MHYAFHTHVQTAQNGDLGKLLPGWRYSEIPVNCVDTELIFVLKPFFQKDLCKCVRGLVLKWWKLNYLRNRSFPLYVISENLQQSTYHLLLWQTSPVRSTSPVDTLKQPQGCSGYCSRLLLHAFITERLKYDSRISPKHTVLYIMV